MCFEGFAHGRCRRGRGGKGSDMRKWERLLILLLMLTNAGLLIHVLTDSDAPTFVVQPAYGQNRAFAAGGYSVTTADLSSSRQALWVVDNREKRMMVYAFPASVGDRRLVPMGRVDLRHDFGADLVGDVYIIPGRISGESDAVYAFDVVGRRVIGYTAKRRNEILILGARNLDEDFKD